MTYKQGIYIDGHFFDIPLIKVSRNAEFLDKYANRTEDGDLKRELIGVYYNYTLEIGFVDDSDSYGDLWDKLTEAVPFHEFTLPDLKGTYTFTGYVSSVSDEMKKIYSNKVEFESLKCKFIAKKPARSA